MSKSSRGGIGVCSFGLLVMALMALTQPLMTMAAAINLGDCEGGVYTPENPRQCANKTFCTPAGCVPYPGAANSCGAGFAIVTIDIAAADRIQTGTCAAAVNQACSLCTGRIKCAKGAGYRNANCMNACGTTNYFLTGMQNVCI